MQLVKWLTSARLIKLDGLSRKVKPGSEFPLSKKEAAKQEKLGNVEILTEKEGS